MILRWKSKQQNSRITFYSIDQTHSYKSTKYPSSPNNNSYSSFIFLTDLFYLSLFYPQSSFPIPAMIYSSVFVLRFPSDSASIACTFCLIYYSWPTCTHRKQSGLELYSHMILCTSSFCSLRGSWCYRGSALNPCKHSDISTCNPLVPQPFQRSIPRTSWLICNIASRKLPFASKEFTQTNTVKNRCLYCLSYVFLLITESHFTLTGRRFSIFFLLRIVRSCFKWTLSLMRSDSTRLDSSSENWPWNSSSVLNMSNIGWVYDSVVDKYLQCFLNSLLILSWYLLLLAIEINQNKKNINLDQHTHTNALIRKFSANKLVQNQSAKYEWLSPIPERFQANSRIIQYTYNYSPWNQFNKITSKSLPPKFISVALCSRCSCSFFWLC